ncbi:Protein asteroid -like protein 1 [Halotydeus destructor]|nr:Protein asteroid -like protein 1 [Halotydeus destructor]
MGIQGLSGLLADNSELFSEPFELKNTKVVIDGTCLLRFLHDSSNEHFMNVQFSGNYVHYGQIVTAFFSNLKANNVQAYVILPGAGKSYVQSENDKRSRDRFRSIRLTQLVTSSKKFLETNQALGDWFADWFPVLTREVFKHVLQELKIPCISVLFNSDTTIAKVANQLNCPVLSSETNFYMFDLKSGFVNFSSMQWDADGISNDDVISGRIYFRSTLVELFNLETEVLPFFAVVVGNSYRKKMMDDKIFNSLRKLYWKTKTCVDMKTNSGNKALIVLLLTWLKGKTLEDAIRDFSRLLEDSDEEIVLQAALKLTRDSYSLLDALDCALIHLQGSACEERHEQLVDDRLGRRHFMQNKMAVEFITGNWIKEVVELKLMRETWSPLDIDDYDQDSAIMVTIPMLSDLISITSESTKQDDSLITVHDWLKTDSGDRETCSFDIEVSSDFTKMVNYDSISRLTLDQRSRLAFAILKSSPRTFATLQSSFGAICNLKVDLAKELALMVLILRYVRHLLPGKKPTDMQYFILSVVQCVIRYMRLDLDPETAKVRKGMSSKRRLESVYLLNIFQRIVKIFGQINVTLGRPLPAIKPERYLNGVYITNLHFDYTESHYLSSLDREILAVIHVHCS